MLTVNPRQYLSQQDPEISPYKNSDSYLAEEKRVIRQLLEALLFEHLCDYSYHDGFFYFTLGRHFYRASGRISGFSRIRINAEEMFFSQRDEMHVDTKFQAQWIKDKSQSIDWQPITLNALIEDLPASVAVKKKLAIELEQTVKLCQWNNEHLNRHISRRELTYTQLESAIDEGHPYHPCFKARTGFSELDHKLYGPEFGNNFQLHWLAIRRCYLKRRFNSVNEKIFWETELGEQCYQQLNTKVKNLTSDSAAFSLMPIHPWQWKYLKDKLETAIADGQVFYLGEAGDQYQASISIRTLLNISHPEKANIKLPLNIINTSSLRTIESHTICTAPAISNWLIQILESDNYLKQNMILLAEYAGIRPTNDGTEHQAWIENLDGQLGVIFRQSLLSYCDEKNVIPFVALSIIEQDDSPFIEPWIAEYGCHSWLENLLEKVVIPIWHLLVHHGIAIEAHGQNILLQHKDGWPEKVIVRDFHESMEYVQNYLAQPELAPTFTDFEEEYSFGGPNQYYWMESVEALRELLVDTLLVFNLSDLAVLLEDYYQFPESEFWKSVYQSFRNYQQSNLTDQKRIAQIDLFQPEIKTESLLDKKFRGNRETEFHHQIRNPLADAALHDAQKETSKTSISVPAVPGKSYAYNK
ncbi:IucA/IucC family protein [Microbulbifer sp. ZKSA002]|uniref:IucA/IucC family protein n=1 Tax=Microbulbifer sp. ZKSA002 TaxID=3243388 RepID=UPI00403A3C87